MGLGVGVGVAVLVGVGVGVGVTVGVGVFVGVAVGWGVGVTVGMPEFVGSGLGVPLETTTNVTNAITMTAARALTIIQGSLDEDAVGFGVDTGTPHRNGLRGDADRIQSLSGANGQLNGCNGSSDGETTILESAQAGNGSQSRAISLKQ